MRWIWRLAAGCAAVLVVTECAAGYILRHHSLTYERVYNQYQAAASLRRQNPEAPKSYLIVGNSLLLEGLDVAALDRETTGQLQVAPLFLELTSYYDWYFAVQRLLRGGARPDAIVVGISAGNMLETNLRREFAPLLLLDGRDIPAAGRQVGMNRTDVADLYASHLSYFWDTRSEIHTQVLLQIVPDIQGLTYMIRAHAATSIGAAAETAASARLKQLRGLCSAYGVRLLILIPPAMDSAEADSTRELERGAAEAKVEVEVPVKPGEWPARYFKWDRTHLNHEGSEKFTDLVSQNLIHFEQGR